MAKTVRFNKTLLTGLVRDQQSVTVKDREVAGLKFTVGKKRSCFVFEKRISGRKGSPIKITIGAFPSVTLDDARRLARSYANLCEQGLDPREEHPKNQSRLETQSVPLRAAVEKFFDLKESLSTRTLRGYRYEVEHHFPAEWMELDMRSITPEMLVEQFYEIRKSARDRCFKFLKVFSNVWNTCSPYFKGPDGKWLLQTNPVPHTWKMLKYVKPDQRRRQFIPASHLGKFVVTLESWAQNKIPQQKTTDASRRFCHLVLLCLFTGMRGIEARSMRWEYVDLKLGVIFLPGRANDEQAQFTGMKNNTDHQIPLSSYPWELLRTLQQQRTTMSPYVFPSAQSVHKPITSYGTYPKLLSKMVGIDFGLHACRRTFASIADDVGLDYLKVKRSLNHSFEGGVTGGYINPGFNPERRRKHFQQICDYILRSKAIHNGEIRRKQEDFDQEAALAKLERYIWEQGLDPEEALHRIVGNSSHSVPIEKG